MRKAIARTLPLSLLVAGALAAPAPAATVASGELEWTQFNVYELAAPAGTNRTWLGYVTGGPPLANGNATASDGATGATVTPASTRGADQAYSFGFPTGTGGTYDEYTGTGTVELTGTLTFTSAAHGFTISVEDPQLEARRQQRPAVRLGREGGRPGRHLRPQPAGLRPRPLRRDGDVARGRHPHAERDRPVDRHRRLRLPGLRPGRRP